MSSTQNIAIFISGRGSNMQAIVEACQSGILKEVAQIAVVFSNKKESAGLLAAQTKGIPTHYIESKALKRQTHEKRLLAYLKDLSIDYIVLAGYMRILSPTFVQHYPQRIINIHPADTQQHQGLNGYEWAFEQQMDHTHITVHLVDEGLDTGTILGQKKVDLRGAETLAMVEKRGLAIEHQFYSEVLKDFFTKN